jgi:hypothetical protein
MGFFDVISFWWQISLATMVISILADGIREASRSIARIFA